MVKPFQYAVLTNAVCLLEKINRKKDSYPIHLLTRHRRHDPLIGYIPHTINNTQATIMREQDPE
jgi:urocanate hydratase